MDVISVRLLCGFAGFFFAFPFGFVVGRGVSSAVVLKLAPSTITCVSACANCVEVCCGTVVLAC